MKGVGFGWTSTPVSADPESTLETELGSGRWGLCSPSEVEFAFGSPRAPTLDDVCVQVASARQRPLDASLSQALFV